MLDKIRKKIREDELLQGSIILFVMINIFNVLNYVFHFAMARMLGPAGYGVLAVLMSVIYIFTIPTEAIQNVVTHYTSKFNYEKKQGKIKNLASRALKKSFLLSLIVFLAFIPISFLLSYLLEIDFFLLVLTGAVSFFIFSLPVMRGVLQGKKKFFGLGMNMVSEGAVKVVFSLLLVAIGWKVYGAMAGVLISVAAAFLIALFSMNGMKNVKEEEAEVGGIYSYSLPYFMAILSIVLMYSLDVFFAKRFFSPEIAGKYAVASILGKMIFFGTFAVSKAMFSLSSENHVNGNKNFSLLKKSLKITGLIGGIVLLAFFFIPGIIVGILFGSQYADAANLVFLTGLAFLFLSFSNVIVLYGLSVGKIKKSSIIFLVFVLLEIIFFVLFHSTPREFILGLAAANFLMLIFSMILIKRKR